MTFQFIKLEDYPDIIKVDFLGMTVLLDYKEESIQPLGGPSRSPESVIKYLIAEGFLETEPENESQE